MGRTDVLTPIPSPSLGHPPSFNGYPSKGFAQAKHTNLSGRGRGWRDGGMGRSDHDHDHNNNNKDFDRTQKKTYEIWKKKVWARPKTWLFRHSKSTGMISTRAAKCDRL